MSGHCVTCRFFEANRLNADAPGRCRHNAPQAAEPTWPTTTPDDWCGQYERMVTQPSTPEPTLVEQAAKVRHQWLEDHRGVSEWERLDEDSQDGQIKAMLKVFEFLASQLTGPDKESATMRAWLNGAIDDYTARHEDAP